MKPLKVVFFGTPEFAKASLKAIHESVHEIVGVVTIPDKASGRGQKIHQSAVKTYALSQGMEIFQPEKLRNENFLNSIKKLNADVFVVVAFRMMPQVLFSLPPLGTFNLHASLLPDYRGAAPINFAIINGEKTSGVSTFFINEKIDEGHLLLQESADICPEDNAGTLHDKLMTLGADLVVKTLDGLSTNSILPKVQPEVSKPKNAFKIFKEDTRINWQQKGANLNNFIRGLSPYPCAFTTLKIGNVKKTLKIFSGKVSVNEPALAPGTLSISKNEFKIYTEDGYYEPTEVQLEGKKRMLVKDFLNGFKNFEQITMA